MAKMIESSGDDNIFIVSGWPNSNTNVKSIHMLDVYVGVNFTEFTSSNFCCITFHTHVHTMYI